MFIINNAIFDAKLSRIRQKGCHCLFNFVINESNFDINKSKIALMNTVHTL